MTRLAWVIDQTRCIGCHACTTACKSENDVALGVFRTWVKAVEVGVFPQVKRHFAVLRCNHCEDAPCVEICPTTAMYQRPDGLVDFDTDRCIGCKACMQACPFDAIHMDPATDTAAKCNFCSHRVDEGLLPACVVVCPEEALLFGDMDDPTSKVAHALGRHAVTVRRPEQDTRPKAFYIGAHDAVLDPLAAKHEATYAWADRTGGPGDGGTAGRSTQLAARVAYDIPRQRTWGWKVSSYIWTKSIAAGAGLLIAWDWLVGSSVDDVLPSGTLVLTALASLALTGVLLVADLKQPARFLTILTRPQWRSWLTRGAFIITAYGALLVAWLAIDWFDLVGAADVVAWLLGGCAVLTAVYTAFLFGQCEGRDLWQSSLVLPHLALEACLAGLATVLLGAAAMAGPLQEGAIARWLAIEPLALAAAWLAGGTAAVALLDALGRHGTPNARAAARALVRGPQAPLFWSSVGALGLAARLYLVGPATVSLAAVFALTGLWLHSHALVHAGQGPPIS